MKKNIILSIAKILSYIWFFLPYKIRRFIFTSFFILESRNNNPSISIKNLFLTKDKLDLVINERALKYGNGIHPKHSLTNYHQFFIDRIKNCQNVLDVGFGNGSEAISIARSLPRSFITGIDINKKNIEFAREKQKEHNLKKLNFINGNINDYFGINSDVVILSNVLEHIENISLFLNNVQTLSGVKFFLIRVPYFKRDWQITFRKKLGIYYFCDNIHKIELTIEELKEEFKGVNLFIKETISVWGEIWTKCEYGN